jgi:GNAT superfamily N-acetyltransferase
VVRKGYRGRGISCALAAAAVGYARANGARALEGHAMRTQPGKVITWGELYVGAAPVYAEAGFREVSRPSVRRVVMRVDFPGSACGRILTGHAVEARRYWRDGRRRPERARRRA